MKKLILVFLIIFCYTLYSDEIKIYNMFKDGKWNYIIALDESWQMEMDLGRKIGFDNFFIPNGYNMNNAPAGIMTYVGVEYNSVNDFINNDLDNFTQRHSGYKFRKIEHNIVNEKNDIQIYKVYNETTPVVQYICYFDNGSDFYFALVLQLFEENEEYLNDFYISSEKSMILPNKYDFSE